MEFGHARSSLENIVSGVPHGSTLVPSFFIIYINDICNVSNIFKFVLSADDTNIFTSNRDIAELYSKTN